MSQQNTSPLANTPLSPKMISVCEKNAKRSWQLTLQLICNAYEGVWGSGVLVRIGAQKDCPWGQWVTVKFEPVATTAGSIFAKAVSDDGTTSSAFGMSHASLASKTVFGIVEQLFEKKSLRFDNANANLEVVTILSSDSLYEISCGLGSEIVNTRADTK